ncbi:hypothetical protein G5714_000362 [Onychostoma macrolepis]|uniref:Cadherin domain-containing protein n=1 Tax=Onychostoma macrolepis TaxID=369639 RepID=A0A7J6DGV3_9TELE|nr:hypothetical protein G5714_000362 [Onychostoma macrolepis]
MRPIDLELHMQGDVEILTNIRPDDRLVLESHLFPVGLDYVELVYSDGESTATVRTRKPLDADELKEYGEKLYYSVACSNTGLKNIRTVDVLDINDNPPIFRNKTYSATVSETKAVGSDVLRVRADDADVSPENNNIIYSILPPVPDDFDVRQDGNIRLKQRLNYNNAQQYIFTVEARDIGALSDTTTVTITVEDYDNLNPYFDYSLYEASIEENQAGQLSDVTPEAIKAQDGDTGINELVVYSITTVFPNEYQSNFNIDGRTGVISVTTALDREETDKITVYIQAAQQDDASKTANAVVSVTIKDVNDNPPKFDQDEYTVSILENSPQDQFVLQTKVTDLDLGGFVGTIQIIPESVPFSISPDGTILVKSSVDLDRETTASFSFKVEAQEKPPSTNKATADVTIVLLDENDNSPQFTTSKYEGKVFSNQTVGMQVVKVEAADLDEGPNGEISYSIEFGNEKGHFEMNENNGEITLVKEIDLVANKILEFALYVTAKDGGAISRSTAAMVNVKAPGESHPQFLRDTYQGQVEEDQADADIVKIDFLSLDPLVPVTLTVESDADKFSINQDTGVLSTNVKLDFEEKSSYTVRVSITDGTNRDEASVLVEVLDINDNSPEFETHPATVSVPEDHTVGDDVASVTAKDADSGFNGEVRYTLLRGAGRFNVNQETGVITLADPLDRETQEVYSLVITAQDQGRPSQSNTTVLEISVTDINDNAPIFSKQQYETTVSEHAEVGTNVIEIMATDKDDGENAIVIYHIVKQEPSSTPPVFTIDEESGFISLAAKLDYGKAKKYTLEVEGRDGGTPVLTGSASVTVWVEDVNDKAPVFSKDQYDVFVYENLAGGTVVVSLEVTDEDEGGFSKGHFIMDSDTFIISNQGVISVRSDATLDRETKDEYIIEVIAVDQPVDGLSSTAQVNITVLDVNDNNPQFLPLPDRIEIQEGVYTPSSPGEVCVISATDSDIGENGRVTIITSSYSNIFSFKDDGTLLAIEELDRETQDVYDVVIVAVDHGIPQGNNITTVRISITDVNDNAPVFSSDTYSRSILIKDAKVGELLLTVSATDKDDGSNAIISYSFSEESSMVALDAETGDITLTSDLSEVTEDMLLTLTAIATDQGTPAQSDEAEVLIHFKISSLNEGVTFESSSYNFAIKENEPEATIVGKVKALTGSPLATVSYNMKSHEDVFSVDEEGTIKALKSLDKEEEEWYILTVEAIDSETPPNTAETTVSVQVENVNEAPVFETEIYKAEIFTITPYKSLIVKVQASDPDVGESSELQYSLVESTSLLEMEANTGQIYVQDASSVGDGLHTFQVKATDKHGLSATAKAEITVKESESDNVVVISLNQPVFTVEKKRPEIEDSMKKALGLTVKILSVRAEDGIEMRTILRESTAKTYISFIAMDTSGAVIEATEVKKKLQSNHDALKDELENVFGTELEFKVEDGSGNSSEDSSEAVVIALSVLLAISIVGIIAMTTVYLVRNKKMKKDTDSDKESFNIGRTKQRSSIDNSFNFSSKKEEARSKEVEFSNTRSTEINCAAGSHVNVGSIQEGYEDVLDVNDNPPIFQSKSYSATVSETKAVGSDVLRVRADDADVSPENNRITYSILPPVPDDFEVRQDGNIRLKQRLNYNNAQQYIFTVEARDIGALSDTTTVTITVEDYDNLNPYFDHSLYEASIEENQAGQLSDVTPEAIKAQDGDTGINEPVVYSITTVFPNEYQSNFNIDERTGVISVTTALDREEIDKITVYIQAAQQDDASKTANAVVSVTIEDVNDNPPKFDQDQYTVSISENSPQDQFVLQIRVSDLDLGGFSTGHFIMDSDTFIINNQGVISVRSDATLDRETKDSYNIEVIAVDQPVDGLSSTAQVNITVLDVNDNNPQFLPLPDRIEIQEGVYTPSSPGEVCVISATDSDIGENGRVTIITYSHSELFSFREDGTLLAIEELDRETQDVYDLNITTVRISITDVNDNAPVFSSDTYSRSILVKDAKVGELLLTVSATDKDDGSNTIISYSFSEESSMVALDAETGDITLTSDLSEVTEDMLLTLTAIATDQGTPAQSDEAEVLIHFKISSLNEGVTFESSSYNFAIKENEPEATIVGKVKALTGSPLATVSYNMKSHEDVFSVDEEGTIKALKSLDKEEEEWYILTVEAIDSRTPPNTAETTVSVQVENVNEAPVFETEIYKAEITPYKFSIVKVQASDPDVGESSELQYSLVESTSLLDVEVNTGQIYVLDASSVGDGLFTLDVKATDKHGLSTTAKVEITVKESESDNVVVISLNQPVFTVEKKRPEIEDLQDASLRDLNCVDSHRKLQSNHNALKDELENVFGTELEFKVEDGSGNSSEDSSEAVVIALSVLLAISIVGIIAMTTVYLVR